VDLIEKPRTLAQRHPWETSRFDFLLRILQRAKALSSGQRVLDVGSGDAWFAKQLIANTPNEIKLTCWDKGYSESEVTHPEKHDARIDWVRERPAERFNLLLLLDVLEHISEDHEFLKDTVSRNAGPKSLMLVTVPCWPSLFGPHDVHLQHVRRYRPKDCRNLLTSTGLSILKEGSFFHVPFLARGCAVLGEKLGFVRKPPKDMGQWEYGAGVTQVVRSVLSIDNRMSEVFSRWGWPVPGLSYWALCQKK